VRQCSSKLRDAAGSGVGMAIPKELEAITEVKTARGGVW
jgi:hypothetical protein